MNAQTVSIHIAPITFETLTQVGTNTVRFGSITHGIRQLGNQVKLVVVAERCQKRAQQFDISIMAEKYSSCYRE